MKLAALDTSVILLVVQTADNEKDVMRREALMHNLTQMRKDGFHFIIPAPAVAELGSPGELPKAVLLRLKTVVASSEVSALTLRAAMTAAEMVAPTLSARDPKQPRACIKQDVLIAAVAHDRAVHLLLTTDKKFERYFEAVHSNVAVLRADHDDYSERQGQLFSAGVRADSRMRQALKAAKKQPRRKRSDA